MTQSRETLERIDPDTVRPGEITGVATLELHLARYRFAREHLHGVRILDIACGVGYGTALLRQTAGIESVVGVDVDAGVIARASERYGSDGVTFVCADARTYGVRASFDSVVSLETLEHVEGPDAFLAHLVSLVRPGGILVVSVPVTPSVDGNPHHRTDFSVRSFRQLGRRSGLIEVDALMQRQEFTLQGVVSGTEVRMERTRYELLGWYIRNPLSLGRRIVSTIQHGFVNLYRTQVWRRPG